MLNPIEFECPVCGAKPGEKCLTITNKAMPKPHAKRLRAALDKKHPPEGFSQATAPIVKEAKKASNPRVLANRRISPCGLASIARSRTTNSVPVPVCAPILHIGVLRGAFSGMRVLFRENLGDYQFETMAEAALLLGMWRDLVLYVSVFVRTHARVSSPLR
jgi:hypothetical protein